MAVERVNAMTAPPLHRARAEREAFGRRLRDRVRRVDHDVWATGTRGVLGRLEASEEHRLRGVLPYRHGRMAASPFAFLRGGAATMAPDLAARRRPTAGRREILVGAIGRGELEARDLD